MTYLLAIDPGECRGWARFNGVNLQECGVGNPPSWGAVKLIIECPRVYPRSRVNPNDLIQLAVKVGRDIARYEQANLNPNSRIVYPQEWKGTISKELCNQRILAKLRPEERVLVPNLPASYLHNCIDAIGLGLFELGRMGRAGV